MSPTAVGELRIAEAGDAQRGTDPKEVVVALSPAFSTTLHETIIGIPHAVVLKEICAGIEEEGMKYRFVRLYKTADVGFLDGKTVSIPLPDISLKNVGKARGGISPGELGQEITNALKAKLSVAGNFERLMKSTGDTLDKAGSAIKGLLK